MHRIIVQQSCSGCHSATKTARKYLPPAKRCAASNLGFFIRSLFSFYHPLTTKPCPTPASLCRGHDTCACLAQGAVFIGGYPERHASRGSLRLTHRLTALACPEAKKARSLAGLFLCFCPVSSAHGQSLPQAPPLLPGWRPRPRGFFYTINSEKTNAHVLLQNQTRVCGIVRCTACSAFLTECGNLCPRKRFFADRIWGGIFQSREKGKA
jgi:hypothetical protein